MMLTEIFFALLVVLIGILLIECMMLKVLNIISKLLSNIELGIKKLRK